MDAGKTQTSSKQKKRKDHTFVGKKHPHSQDHGYGNKHYKDRGIAGMQQTKVKYEYMKLLKKERQQSSSISQPRIVTMDTDSSDSEDGNQAKLHRKKKKTWTEDQTKQHMFSKAQNRFKMKKEAKEKQQQELLHRTERQKHALGRYHDRKKRRHLMLCKKTNRGQPVMKHQMNYLLAKIHQQTEHKS